MEWRTHDAFGYYYTGYPMHIVKMPGEGNLITWGETIFNHSLFLLAALQGGP